MRWRKPKKNLDCNGNISRRLEREKERKKYHSAFKKGQGVDKEMTTEELKETEGTTDR
jgi:hypothetical protein